MSTVNKQLHKVSLKYDKNLKSFKINVSVKSYTERSAEISFRRAYQIYTENPLACTVYVPKNKIETWRLLLIDHQSKKFKAAIERYKNLDELLSELEISREEDGTDA